MKRTRSKTKTLAEVIAARRKANKKRREEAEQQPPVVAVRPVAVAPVPAPPPPSTGGFITDPAVIAAMTPEAREAEYRRQADYYRMVEEIKLVKRDPQAYFAREARRNQRDFSEASLSILTKEGNLTPFIWNPAQIRYNATLDRIRAANRPARIVILKTRRSGFTTASAGRFFTETALRPGQSTLVVSHDYESVQKAIYPMFSRFQQHYRPYRDILRLPKVKYDTEHGIEWHNGSAIRIATAKNLEGARSFGYRFVLFSEAAFYPDFATLLTSVMQTVPNDPNTVVVVESTANGVGGPYYDLCMEAMDATRRSEWEFIFFGWQDDPECVMRLPMPTEEFEASLGNDRAYNARSGEERELRDAYHLTLEQLYWRRWTIDNKCQHSIAVFNQEYPSSSAVAFLVSGRPALDTVSIERYHVRTGVVGSITPTLVGAETRLQFGPDPGGFITLYKRPEKRGEYVAGSDTAEGIDRNRGKGNKPNPDFSVTQILDRFTGEQCAVLRGRMYEKVFGQLTAWLCRMFNWAYLVPEVQRGYGRAMLDAVLAEDYPMDRIYHRRSPLDQTERHITPRYDDLGWETTTATRPRLVSALNMALMERSVELYDAITVQELRSFVIGPDGKAEATQGEHDDTTIALGLAVIGLINAPAVTRDFGDPYALLSGPPADAYDTYTGGRMRDRAIAAMIGTGQQRDDPETEWRRRTLLG